MQPTHTIPGVMAMGYFFWLGVFMLLGFLVNKVRGKPSINGALWFCYVASALVIYAIVAAMISAKALDPAINLVGALIVPYLVAFFLARKFKARQAAWVRPQ